VRARGASTATFRRSRGAGAQIANQSNLSSWTPFFVPVPYEPAPVHNRAASPPRYRGTNETLNLKLENGVPSIVVHRRRYAGTRQSKLEDFRSYPWSQSFAVTCAEVRVHSSSWVLSRGSLQIRLLPVYVHRILPYVYQWVMISVAFRQLDLNRSVLETPCHNETLNGPKTFKNPGEMSADWERFLPSFRAWCPLTVGRGYHSSSRTTRVPRPFWFAPPRLHASLSIRRLFCPLEVALQRTSSLKSSKSTGRDPALSFVHRANEDPQRFAPVRCRLLGKPEHLKIWRQCSAKPRTPTRPRSRERGHDASGGRRSSITTSRRSLPP